jgi:hypothetical protein
MSSRKFTHKVEKERCQQAIRDAGAPYWPFASKRPTGHNGRPQNGARILPIKYDKR